MKLSILATVASLFAGSAIAGCSGPACGAVEARSDNHQLVARQSLATKKTRTNKIMYQTSISYFQVLRDKKNPSWLIWTSDGCSYVDDWPKGYPFVRACRRHDFGYRNFKKQNRFTKTNKNNIDAQFYKE